MIVGNCILWRKNKERKEEGKKAKKEEGRTDAVTHTILDEFGMVW